MFCSTVNNLRKFLKFNILKSFLIICLSLGLYGCSSSGQLVMDLMISPGIYSETDIDPFADYSRVSESPVLDVLYATNRAPVEKTRCRHLSVPARAYPECLLKTVLL